jgi:hypothetical protein
LAAQPLPSFEKREREREMEGEERRGGREGGERYLEPSALAGVDSLFPFLQSSFCLILLKVKKIHNYNFLPPPALLKTHTDTPPWVLLSLILIHSCTHGEGTSW